jgi:hypothetical protein
MERETGIEPATNSLEGCDSTTELLPRLLRINQLGGSQSLLAPSAPLPTVASRSWSLLFPACLRAAGSDRGRERKRVDGASLFRVQHADVAEAQRAYAGFNLGPVSHYHPHHMVGLHHGVRRLGDIAEA